MLKSLHKETAILCTWCSAFVFLFMLSSLHAAEFPQTVSVKLKTLLISLEDYRKAPLNYAENDLTKLSNILQLRYGAQSECFIDTPQDIASSETDDRSVIKREIENRIRTWTKSLESGDTAILYVAGHGILNDKKELFLPMINFSFDHFEETAIPLKWIKEQLNLAKSRCKLVILDACHAGTAKDQSAFSFVDSESMAKELQSTQIATLASSKSEQKSWLWNERKHSLFTYWLIEGLRGNADQDRDQIISLNELQNYIATNVAQISSNTAGMTTQNPVLLNSGAIDKHFVLRLKARKIKDVINNMAEQINFAIQHARVGLVMVPEFTSADQSKISSEFGILARNLAKRMEDQLKILSDKKYSILDENETRQILTENDLKTTDL